MAQVTIKQLLETGVHFGHRTQRWNPKMAPYIFTKRRDIHIINLKRTLKELKNAYLFVRDSVSEGKKVLFVGTKRQIQKLIGEEAKRCGMFYINHRWLGGMLTNFSTIHRSLMKLREFEHMEEDGTLALLPKKEQKRILDKKEKLLRIFGGIMEMDSLPDLLFVVDTKREEICIKEARKTNLPIVAIVDTNSDPDEIDYCIPGNDDAIRGVRLIVSHIADAVIEGLELYREKVAAKTEGTEEESRGVEDREERKVMDVPDVDYFEEEFEWEEGG